MRRIIWFLLSAVIAAIAVTAAYQANTSNTHGKTSVGNYQQSGQSSDTNRYKDLKLR